MTENISSSPIFADRYRFQPVSADWDVGRSGYTHLVFDIKKERLGVIKRAELKSPRAVEGLKNEVAALLDLKGKGVPEVYDTGDAEYGSKTYFYMVIEYIDGIRLEKNLKDVTVTERADILLQFWNLLSAAQSMGIVNGDIDLKHLYWRPDKKELVVIDWGNARLNIKPNSSDFVFDLARAAEITYAMVSRNSRAPVSGPLTLPKDASLMPGLAPVPPEFRSLCKWAPRTPSSRAQTRLTAYDIYDATEKWIKGVPYKPIKQANWALRLILIVILMGAVFLFLLPTSPINILPTAKTTSPSITVNVITTEPVATSDNTTKTVESPITITPTHSIATEVPTNTITFTPTEMPTFVPSPPITPLPRTYTTILMDTSEEGFPTSNCWEPLSTAFTKRSSDNYMQFEIDNGQFPNVATQVDFSGCITNLNQVKAIGINADIQILEIERTILGQPEDGDGRQFGFFIENSLGKRREYILWVDRNSNLQLRIRENDQEPINQQIYLNEGTLKIRGDYPGQSAVFPIQFFLEVNNIGFDIFYIKEGKSQIPLDASSLPIVQWRRIDQAILPTLGDGTVTKLGLIGYGGQTQVAIWPLAIFGE